MHTLLTCRGLVCRLDRQLVLDGLDLELSPGESLALLGSSGSGKSTLLRVIAGLELPERGDVLLSGAPATHDGRLLTAPHRRNVAMLFQDLALWPNLTVGGNVRLGLAATRLSPSHATERVAEMLMLCGIAGLSDRLPGTLSGGQQQRVALARALAVQPRLLLLDEPFAGLDLLTRESILQEIARLKEAQGFGLILVTHDPSEVLRLCDSIAVLDAGRIVDRAPVATLTSDARSAVAQAFAKHIP